ncbi:MAG: prepilin-type N-terminal cleavage/methylation domain-containing protein [Gammaproteobacteria bacterium]|nr:prepilin-type N-terminal cleavage/methylation domain-containing protein [Gammaproteobacteria bacterium]
MTTPSSRPRLARIVSPRVSTPGGFTLIEIVITVAILAILSALAVPFYEGYVLEARIGTAIKDIRQMELVINDRFLDDDPPATLAAAGINLVDPWGNAYRYLWIDGNPAPGVNGDRRRDRSMNPVNTDYDLYSVGPDGETTAQFTAQKALDDIVRANDGDFIGLAGDH